jgi:MATE family multidrug resistance protein
MINSTFQIFSINTISARKIWLLAWPMILANISVPLLGFVDVAVIGHLPSPAFLAGTTLGSLVIMVLFWLLGFLRMSTTGLVAQALGDNNAKQEAIVVTQGVSIALVLSAIILLTQTSVFSYFISLLSAESDLTDSINAAQTYFSIRIWSAPISLINLVLTGYLIGKGQTKTVLYALFVCNLVNLIADIIMVPILGLNVAGVAYASVLAEVTLFIFLLSRVYPQIAQNIKFNIKVFVGSRQLLTLNGLLFVRSVLLQLCLSFITIYATRYGEIAVATNAIVMQFFMFISFTMDGIAFALESLIGQLYGKKQKRKVVLFIRTGLRLATLGALIYCLAYWLFGEYIVYLLTNIPRLQTELEGYYGWILLLPIVSYISFILDGVFVGLAYSYKMFKSMLIAAITFFVVFYLTRELGNHALWLAFCSFMLARGLSQLYMVKKSSFI